MNLQAFKGLWAILTIQRILLSKQEYVTAFFYF